MSKLAGTNGTHEPDARHAPSTGRLRRWLGPFYFTGVFWYRFHLFGVTVVPEFLLGPVVSLFTVVFFVALGRVRSSIASNLEAVLGPCGFFRRQLRVWRTLRTFAWCLSERYEQFVPGKSFEDDVIETELARGILQAPPGFVMVTAHLGNWEVASVLSVASSNRVCNLVREKELDPAAQRFLRGLLSTREGNFYRTHFAGDDPRLMLTLRDALRRGEMVGLQADRPRAGGRAVTVEICGIAMPIPIGPIALARSSDVLIVPVFFFRTGRRTYKCLVRDPIRVSRSSDSQEDIEVAAHRIAREIEWAVRESPHEWYCFSDLAAEAEASGLRERKALHRDPLFPVARRVAKLRQRTLQEVEFRAEPELEPRAEG